MRFALDKNANRVEVTASGELAACPNCGSVLVGRKGEERVEHWSHKSENDCDSWHEPITQWHLDWQNLFPKEFQEISIKDESGKIAHRADIKLKNDLVIEIQNSPIKIDNIKKREEFYGVKNMIWVLNGETLAQKSHINYRFNKKHLLLTFSIPHYMDLDFDLEEYNIDEFKELLFKDELLQYLKSHKDLKKFEIQNENFFSFEFDVDLNFERIGLELHNVFQRTCDNLYLDFKVVNQGKKDVFPALDFAFYTDFIRIKKDRYSRVFLEKKHWRKFIDKMTFPVFIDNMEGLAEGLLYWYQENKIIKKSDFINNYLKYT